MKSNIILSIITPSYNRAKTLAKCYDSLSNQTNYDFEWIIVDDGSGDNTEDVVKGFSTDAFPIIYVKKENGGKHTALNASHPYIHGKYVLILDSDDYLIPSAVETVITNWAGYESNSEIIVLIFLRGTDENHPLCMSQEKDEYMPVDILRYKRQMLVSNDACEVIKTEYFLKYPFPVFEGERFVAENALWDRLIYDGKCVYINKVIYICEYLQDGLTRSGRKMRIHNPNGGMFTSNLDMVTKNFFARRVKYGLLYTCYGFFAGNTPVEMSKKCSSKALMWMCLPFGWAMYHLWKKQLK